jgi:hypothetical protein
MNKFLIFAFVLFLLGASSAFAYSGFPNSYYPGNQYGHEATFYRGPWGEHAIYGSHAYFPNYQGYKPYGFRSYGYMYSPWQMRMGDTMSGPRYYNTPYVMTRY